MPRSDIKSVICAVLTRWTMHYQSYKRLGELEHTIVTVIKTDERKSAKDQLVITGDKKTREKAEEMARLIKN